ncbi:alginate export family protein [Arenicella xantha]|uniref:Alginate export protein n=1 Tax=Arenicella xantha TaxID=644221 RepID=A0A395JQ37_9GAMM|nr:alginate export family protein [Arenicella xantha]RBP53453.1 alginate export protein [Arenicella xantha]
MKRVYLVIAICIVCGNSNAQDNAKDAGKVYGDFRLRYESVHQSNALQDADALTLRSRLGYKSADWSGLSATLEVEDSRSLIDDFSVPPAGVKPGRYSVIADPEVTEIDQAFVQYTSSMVTAKVGRQVFTLDGHRFVGHVGWRQDRQTFDGVVVAVKPIDGLVVNAAYLNKRNRIFAEEADIDSKDVILNTSYQTPFGKLVGYTYLLEVDNGLPNALDTYGVSLSGAVAMAESKLLYAAEYAKQETNNVFDTDYLLLEGGAVWSGITAKLGYEVLSSDDGANGFATPLATLHKFNGWSDQFLVTPNQGLEDVVLSVAGQFAGGKWLAAYHDYSSDLPLNGVSDLGDEVNVQYTRGINKHFSAGIKFSAYSAGDAAFGKVDTDKLWVWAGAKF